MKEKNHNFKNLWFTSCHFNNWRLTSTFTAMRALLLLSLLGALLSVASATAGGSGARFRVDDGSPGENWACAPVEDPQDVLLPGTGTPLFYRARYPETTRTDAHKLRNTATRIAVVVPCIRKVRSIDAEYWETTRTACDLRQQTADHNNTVITHIVPGAGMHPIETTQTAARDLIDAECPKTTRTAARDFYRAAARNTNNGRLLVHGHIPGPRSRR